MMKKAGYITTIPTLVLLDTDAARDTPGSILVLAAAGMDGRGEREGHLMEG